MKSLELDQKIPTKQKEFLMALFSDIFNACFASNIENCDTYGKFRRLIYQNAEEIGEYLDLEIVDEDDLDRKDREISDLEEEVEDLEDRLSQYESGSLLDEWKAEILKKYLHKFTPLELEERLKD
jgi:hypothetical protein